VVLQAVRAVRSVRYLCRHEAARGRAVIFLPCHLARPRLSFRLSQNPVRMFQLLWLMMAVIEIVCILADSLPSRVTALVHAGRGSARAGRHTKAWRGPLLQCRRAANAPTPCLIRFHLSCCSAVSYSLLSVQREGQEGLGTASVMHRLRACEQRL